MSTGPTRPHDGEAPGMVERALRDLQQRVEALEADNRNLRAVAGLHRAPADHPAATSPTAGGAQPAPAAVATRVSRRRMLQTSGGLAAAGLGLAIVGDVARPEAAAAAQGGGVILGNANDAGGGTTQIDTNIGNGNPGFVFKNNGSGDGVRCSSVDGAGVSGKSGNASGVVGVSTDGYGVDAASTNGAAVHAISVAGIGVQAESGSSIGVYASSGTDFGIYGLSGSLAGVVGTSTTGKGGWFETGSGPQLYLANTTVPRPGPLADGRGHQRGEIILDSTGDLWACATDGVPGTWRKLAGAATAGALHVLPAPVRVYDSRPGTLPGIGPKTKLAVNTARTLDLTLNSSGVPAGATAALVTLLLVNAAAGNGNFTIWANGVARPGANTMVWGGSTGRVSSPATTALDAAGKCQVVSALQTDIVLDVVGYYR